MPVRPSARLNNNLLSHFYFLFVFTRSISNYLNTISGTFMLNKGVGSVLFKDGVAWVIQTPENEVRAEQNRIGETRGEMSEE